MTLQDDIKSVMDDFENSSSEKIFNILNEIKPNFKSPLISEYLEGKILKISDASDEAERMKQCKALLPYFDWYLQGL